MILAPMDDPFDLQRFVDAQDGGIYERALAELQAASKRTHWMWFIFPQLRALGRSPMAQHYGLAGLDEARAYLEHPLLGPRLTACAAATLMLPQGPNLNAVLGSPDDLKFRSSMTLFALAAGGDGGPFQQALDRWCEGDRDQATLDLVQTRPKLPGS